MKALPLTVKRSIELLGLVLLGWVIVVGKAVLVPLVIAFFVSIILLPVLRALQRRGVPQVPAIGLCLLLMMASGIVVGLFFSMQVSKLLADFPRIHQTMLVHAREVSEWLYEKTNYSSQQQLQLFRRESAQGLASAGVLLHGAVASVSSVFVLLGLMPIYVFLLLFYRNLLLQFVFMWFAAPDREQVRDALRATETIVKSYLTGLLLQIGFVTVLIGGALQLLGVPQALLLGLLLAFLNLIPYVGIFLGTALGLLIILASSPELLPLAELVVVVVVVHFLDQNILRPRVVGSKVKINALSSIVGVVIGSQLAGIAGMLLSLPVMAVLKVLFEHTTMFAQWAVLLGDHVPATSPMHLAEPTPSRSADAEPANSPAA